MPRSYWLGFDIKLGVGIAGRERSKDKSKNNFSNLCFCLILCPVLSFGGLIWDFWRKEDWIGRGKDLAALNKGYTRKLSGFFIVKMWQMLTIEAVSHMPAIFLEISYMPKNQYIL